MVSPWSKLKKAGVLSINERNLGFIFEHNSRRAYPLADDKLLMKDLAIQHGVSVPALYGQFAAVGELRRLAGILDRYDDFVIKPAHGAGGEGVLVIAGRDANTFLSPGGTPYSLSEVRHHITSILSGMYSLGGRPDKAMLEYRVKFAPVFSEITYQGVPDVRIIVYQGVPVMAMLRLPTRASQGRANLHQGAIGAGVCISTGQTLSGVLGSSACEVHPDTEASIVGVQIPHWDRLLEIAAGCFEMTGLGYLGVDLVLDEELGPLLLEINARPGLAIQIANKQGLRNRLKHVEQSITELSGIDQKLSFARESFTSHRAS